MKVSVSLVFCLGQLLFGQAPATPGTTNTTVLRSYVVRSPDSASVSYEIHLDLLIENTGDYPILIGRSGVVGVRTERHIRQDEWVELVRATWHFDGKHRYPPCMVLAPHQAVTIVKGTVDLPLERSKEQTLPLRFYFYIPCTANGQAVPSIPYVRTNTTRVAFPSEDRSKKVP